MIDGVTAPDGLEDGAVGEDPIAIARKQAEGLEFFRGEADLDVVAHHPLSLRGRKEKLKHSIAPSDVAIATVSVELAATSSTMRRNDVETMAAFLTSSSVRWTVVLSAMSQMPATAGQILRPKATLMHAIVLVGCRQPAHSRGTG